MRIATVDAVQGGVIRCTLAIEARGLPLMGQYAIIRQGDQVILGRFGTINLTNPIHEDPTFKPYIMVHGRVPEWSKDVDIEESTLEILGMIDGKNQKIPRQNNPSTGTDIDEITQDVLVRFYNDPAHTITLGVIPNTGDIPATISNRHFGAYETGGYGESRHCAIYGQNGSGKTVFALMLIVAKLLAHPEMGLCMPDTAGDLSDATRHNRGDFRWNYLEACQAGGLKIDVIDVSAIRLTSRSTLKHLLAPVLDEALSVRADKAETLADRIVESLFDGEVDVVGLTTEAVLAAILAHIEGVYAKASRADKLAEAMHLRENPGQRRPFERHLARVRHFFDGREKLEDLVKDILTNGRKVVIRMHDSLSEREQEYVMRELMQALTRQAQGVYKGLRRSCNALIVLDEGARWIPEGETDARSIGAVIESALRETRKYGLGWTVISQRMSDVSKALLSQAHTRYYGRGLGVGQDRRHLENDLGEDGVASYDQLDRQGGFFWVGKGQDTNLGTDGMHFAIHPFGGDATTAFLDANPHLKRRLR
jgi:hypothetical protein